jgi:hypothetical protein
MQYSNKFHKLSGIEIFLKVKFLDHERRLFYAEIFYTLNMSGQIFTVYLSINAEVKLFIHSMRLETGFGWQCIT